MSDSREEAEQKLVAAGMASGMEDSLGSALDSSFSMPKPAGKPKASGSDAPTATGDSLEAEASSSSGPDVPTPGMDTWKDTYEGYLSSWQAESAEAREKALKTREKYEREAADLRQSQKQERDKVNEEKRRKEEIQKREERLRAELEGGKDAKSSILGLKADQDREHGIKGERLKEAWEMIKDSNNKDDGAIRGLTGQPETDVRGTTDQDLVSGQIETSAQGRSHVKQTAYDPTSSNEPMPPYMQNSDPNVAQGGPSTSNKSTPPFESSGTFSRHSATTSQAWEEISPSSSSAEHITPPDASTDSEELVRIHRPQDSRQPQYPQGNGPPAQPPSLTLSVFTNSSHLTFGRVMAILGINLVLPFINGVMLGFGEIFAREVTRVGRIWYRGGGSFWGLFTGREEPRSFGGAGGVSGVGLSGSRGF